MQHYDSNISRLKNIQELWVFWMKRGKALSFIGFAFSFENQFRCLWCQQQMKKYCPQLFFFFQFSSGNKYSCKETAAAKKYRRQGNKYLVWKKTQLLWFLPTPAWHSLNKCESSFEWSLAISSSSFLVEKQGEGKW